MKECKLIIAIVLVLIWLIVIFIFSGMNGDESHSKSKDLIKSVAVSTNSTQKNIVHNAVTNETKVSVENSNENNKTSEQEKEKQKRLNELFEKYDTPIRKIAHATEYGILFLLVLNLIYQIRNQIKYKYLLISILYCFIYAGSDELHQRFIIGRDASFRDVMIDTIGAITVCIIFIIIRNMKKTKNSKKLLHNKKDNGIII